VRVEGRESFSRTCLLDLPVPVALEGEGSFACPPPLVSSDMRKVRKKEQGRAGMGKERKK
jgi:hypothetical protein